MLVPPQVGVTTPSLEIETRHGEASIAHTTKTREVRETGDGGTHTSIYPLPVRVDDGRIWSALSNE